MPAIYLPDGYQYVGAAISSTFLVITYQVMLVGRARKRAGIAYPQLYAEKAEAEKNRDARIFNCTQRAHQNTLESHTIITLGTALVGLKYPICAAVACGIWSIGRISYTVGYTTGDPAKRVNFLAILGNVAVVGSVLASAFIWGKAAITGEF